MLDLAQLQDYLARRFAELNKKIEALESENVRFQGLISDLQAAEAKDGEPGLPGEKGEPGPQGIQGDPGPRGVGIADLMLDMHGNLVATFDDGRMKELGKVKGEDGKDGLDGISLESFVMNYHAETQELEFVARANGKQESVKFEVPLLVNRGYWREGMKARALETYSLDGCLWIANEATTSRPGTDSKAWTLAARKGRDGKDAKDAKSDPVKL